MDHRQYHWLEKVQAQLAVVVALAVVYFLIWPIMRPWDPQEPVSFLVTCTAWQLLVLALVVAAMALLVGVITVSGRPEGSLMAVLIGAGGISLRSAPFRGLLWLRQDSLGMLYGNLILETLILAFLAMAAWMIVIAVRVLVSKVRPNWVWRPPPAAPLYDRSTTFIMDPKAVTIWVRCLFFPFFVLQDKEDLEALSRSAPSPRNRLTIKEALQRTACCLLLGLAIAAVLLMLLMRSDQRGQTLFAIFASLLLATLIAHQTCPVPCSLMAWVLPLVLAIVFYALGATTTLPQTPQGWTELVRSKPYAEALPVDWMTFGIGGSLLGFWFSSRIHELRHIEAKEGKGEPARK